MGEREEEIGGGTAEDGGREQEIAGRNPADSSAATTMT